MDATAQQGLQARVEEIARDVDGIIGDYIKDLATGAEVAHNAEMVFPMASVVKVPILYALYRQAESGGVDLGARTQFAEQHLVPGSGILQDLDFGIAPTLKDLATLMIIVSDNAATDLVIEQIGLDRVEATMGALGLTSITVPLTIRGLLYNTVGLDAANPAHTYDQYQQRTKENYIDWECRAYGDVDNNVSSPRDMALLLEDIERRATLGAASCDAMIDIMKRQKYNTIIPLHLPSEATSAHKTGSLRGIRNDAGIVYHAQGAYLISLFSKRLADPVAGAAALAEVSKATWEAIVGLLPMPKWGV